MGAFTDLYELRGSPWNNTGDTEIVNNHNWFILQNECPTRDCTPKMRTDPPYTPAEQESYDKMKHITETVSASDYTGANRIMANPMDYESKSYLAKVGYRFDDTHYVGGVFENTKQEYDIQDMGQEAYITPAFLKKYMSGTPAIRGVYYGDNLLSGLVVPIAPHNLSLGYTRGFYFDEHHDKNRHGINYHYTPKAHAWIDDLRLSYDRQSIKLDTLRRETSCAVYPTFDENCRADITKPLSGYLSERNTYKEQHDVLQLSAQKSFKFANTEHRVNVLMGMDKFDSALRRGDWYSEQAQTKVTNLGGKGKQDDPYVYQFEPTTIHTEHFCKDGFSTQDCTDRNITGYNHFFAIRDHIQLGDKVDLGLGVRYDRHKFDSDDDFTATGKYSNWSWNTGLTFHATDNIALSYRRSNGFRVPAFYELYGTRGAYDGSNAVSVARQYISQLDPETSSNQEFGIGLTGNFGYLEVSHFDNKYRNLITVGEKIGNGSERNDGYHNLQDIRLSGINVLGKIDWYGVWDKLPDGLYTTLAYNKITPKELSIKEGYTKVRTPILDTLQPARYVAGLGYDSPDDKWGVNLMATYSKAKNADELQGVSTFGIDRAIVATQGATKRWYTYDLSGYYHVNDSMTLRAGVYNLFNRKYSTWESVRQSSINAVNPTTGNTARYAAPGRNFNVALEFKF